MTVHEAIAAQVVLRRLVSGSLDQSPAGRRELTQAVERLAGRAHRTMKAGVTAEQVRVQLAELYRTEKRWGDAIDWLLNSRYMDPEALVAFWGVVDGRWSVDDADKGSIDGTPLTEIPAEDADE
ncbi:hypothetical protein [Sphaerisporangium album]|nr:hypothetical protein [Sphaerisporangium album]